MFFLLSLSTKTRQDSIMQLTASYYIYLFLLTANCILYGSSAIYTHKKEFNLLFRYLIAMVVVEISSNLVARIYENNLFLSHIYYFLHGLFLISFMFKTTLNLSQKRIIKHAFILILTIEVIQYLLFPTLFLGFNPLEVILVNYLLILCTLFHFYNTLGTRHELNYISIGILIYSIIDLSILTFGNLIAKTRYETSWIVWLIREFSILAFYTLFLLQWIKLTKTKVNLSE